MWLNEWCRCHSSWLWFLSENKQFAQRCDEEGIKFIGPHIEHLDMFGDKVKARTTAINAKLPVIPGTDGPIENFEATKPLLKKLAFL